MPPAAFGLYVDRHKTEIIDWNRPVLHRRAEFQYMRSCDLRIGAEVDCCSISGEWHGLGRFVHEWPRGMRIPFKKYLAYR